MVRPHVVGESLYVSLVLQVLGMRLIVLCEISYNRVQCCIIDSTDSDEDYKSCSDNESEDEPREGEIIPYTLWYLIMVRLGTIIVCMCIHRFKWCCFKTCQRSSK